MPIFGVGWVFVAGAAHFVRGWCGVVRLVADFAAGPAGRPSAKINEIFPLRNPRIHGRNHLGSQKSLRPAPAGIGVYIRGVMLNFENGKGGNC